METGINKCVTDSAEPSQHHTLSKGLTLTGGDGPHFAGCPQPAQVGRVNVAVVVGGGLQVSHHGGDVGVGEVQR